MPINEFITKADDLETIQEKINDGFLQIVLQKTELFNDSIKKVLDFKKETQDVKEAKDLLNIPKIEGFLLTASGLSEKSLKNISVENKNSVKKQLVDEYLTQAESNFKDEAIYRFLLAEGDAVGGKIRNKIGTEGQARLVQFILCVLKNENKEFQLRFNGKKSSWETGNFEDSSERAKEIKGLQWKNSEENGRCLIFNSFDDKVKKNIDLSLYETIDSANSEDLTLPPSIGNPLMFGELKSGIDPAGADEHWKTAWAALGRIKDAYRDQTPPVKTCFVGAAIQGNMATEIYNQLESKELSYAANLTNDNQLKKLCEWIISL